MPARTATVALVIAAGLVTAGCSLLEDPSAPDPTLPPPEETDIAFGADEGCPGRDDDCGGSQQLDIYRSDEPGPNPVLVYLHGGGFVGGDKIGSLSEELDAVRDAGWDIVSANYRLTRSDGADRFPAALHDAKRAVRWIKANAAAQDWDATNVAAMGHSAGGNLAGMLAVTAGQADLEPTNLSADLAAVDSTIVAAITLNPVSDIRLFADGGQEVDSMQTYMGCTGDCTEAFARGSVQTHVDPQSAPMLAVHGDLDLLASPRQGELVQEAYEEAGIPDRFELIVVDDGPDRYRSHDIDYPRFVGRFVEFLETHRR